MEESEGETGGLPLLLSCTHGTMIFLPEKKVEGRKEGREELVMNHAISVVMYHAISVKISDYLILLFSIHDRLLNYASLNLEFMHASINFNDERLNKPN